MPIVLFSYSPQVRPALEHPGWPFPLRCLLVDQYMVCLVASNRRPLLSYKQGSLSSRILLLSSDPSSAKLPGSIYFFLFPQSILWRTLTGLGLNVFPTGLFYRTKFFPSNFSLETSCLSKRQITFLARVFSFSPSPASSREDLGEPLPSFG